MIAKDRKAVDLCDDNRDMLETSMDLFFVKCTGQDKLREHPARVTKKSEEWMESKNQTSANGRKQDIRNGQTAPVFPDKCAIKALDHDWKCIPQTTPPRTKTSSSSCYD